MSHKIVERLNKSLDELERSVKDTRAILIKKEGLPGYVLEHVDQYFAVLEKQRALAVKLESYLDKNDFDQVTRHVRLINGLSTMIKEDAQSLIDEANNNSKRLINSTQVC